MSKEKLNELMKRFLIFESDLEGIFDFCSILLEERAKEIEEKEPYATNTIRRYKDAAYHVFDLMDYVEEILKGENE